MPSKSIGNINSTLSTVEIIKYSTSVMSEFIWDHEELFVDEFIGGYVIAFTKLSFDGEYVHFVYVADDGSHVSDYISMERFINWVRIIFKEGL